MSYPPHPLSCMCAECVRYRVSPIPPWPSYAKAPPCGHHCGLVDGFCSDCQTQVKIPMCNCPMPNPIVHVIGCPSRVDPKDALIKELGAKLAAQRNELAMLNALNVNQGRTISQRHAAVDHLNRKIDKLQGDLAVANKTIDELMVDKQWLRNQLKHREDLCMERWDALREQDKKIEAMRSERAEVVKAAGESLAEFQSIIKSLREQLAARSVEVRNEIKIDPEQGSMLLQLIKYHRVAINEILK